MLSAAPLDIVRLPAAEAARARAMANGRYGVGVKLDYRSMLHSLKYACFTYLGLPYAPAGSSNKPYRSMQGMHKQAVNTVNKVVVPK